MTVKEIPDAVLDADIAILAKKGAGKSYTAKGIVERLLDRGDRVLIFDPLEIWKGLRTSSDGKGPGYPIAVFGGPGADMDITPEMATPLAAKLAKTNLPAVIQIGSMTRSDGQRIVRDMLAELFRLNREPICIVLEEAHVFAPQMMEKGLGQEVFSQVDRIARMGRAYGFRLITITQRAARLHKDVLTQAATLIAMKTTSSQDRDAIKAWIEGNGDRARVRDIVDSLAGLSVGEGWVWATDIDMLERIQFPRIKTLDNSATPKAGQLRIDPVSFADVDLSDIKAALAVPSVSEKAGKRKKRTHAAPSVDVEPIRVAAHKAGYDKGWNVGHDIGSKAADTHWRELLEALLGRDTVKAEQSKKPAFVSAPNIRRKAQPSTALTPAAQRMLDVLDTNPPIRMSWNSLAAAIGNKARGGNFNAARKSMRDLDVIREDGGLVWISPPSKDAPTASSPAQLAEMLRGRWKSILGGRSSDIVDLLTTNGPMQRYDIALALGIEPRGGHWNSAWKALRDNSVITMSANDVASLAPELAPENDLSKEAALKARTA